MNKTNDFIDGLCRLQAINEFKTSLCEVINEYMDDYFLTFDIIFAVVQEELAYFNRLGVCAKSSLSSETEED